MENLLQESTEEILIYFSKELNEIIQTSQTIKNKENIEKKEKKEKELEISS